MRLEFYGSTDAGIVRSTNQDAYYINEPEGLFFIVADGMGGHAGGEEASRIATQNVRDFLLAHWNEAQSTSELLVKALLQANQAILDDQQQHPQRSDMGTTIVMVVFRDPDPPFCAHVGDSRLYRFRDSQLLQVTEDHTWVAKAVKMGDITPEEARVHRYRHVLSRCLGRPDLKKVDIQPLDINQGDRLLLCSDGLTEELDDQHITHHLSNTPNLATACESLIKSAKQQGGRDNITVIMISV